jgi:hypothetical protein
VLQHDRLDARPRRHELEHRVDDVVERAQPLAALWMRDAGRREERPPAALRPEHAELRVSAVHREPEPKGEIAFESRRVVGNEMGAIGITRERADLVEEPRTLEQLG